MVQPDNRNTVPILPILAHARLTSCHANENVEHDEWVHGTPAPRETRTLEQMNEAADAHDDRNPDRADIRTPPPTYTPRRNTQQLLRLQDQSTRSGSTQLPPRPPGQRTRSKIESAFFILVIVFLVIALTFNALILGSCYNTSTPMEEDCGLDIGRVGLRPVVMVRCPIPSLLHKHREDSDTSDVY
jgi:hypothetical protein